MAAQTWDIQLLAAVAVTGVGNTTSIGVGSATAVAAAQLKPPYSLVFGVGAEPSQLVIASASQATTVTGPGPTTLDFTGPLPGTTIQIETDTTPTGL